MSKLDKASEIINIAKKEDGMLSKASKLVSAPQRYTMNKLAEILKAKGNKESSEASAQAIVEKLAEASGLPDSTAVNIAKALGVAGLEVFADPTNLVPVGKIGKGLGMVAETTAKHLPPATLEKLMQLKKAVAEGKINLSDDVAKRLDMSMDAQTPSNVAQIMPEKFQGTKHGMLERVPEKPNYGKVTVKAPEEKIGSVKNIAKDAPKQNMVIIEPGKPPRRMENSGILGSADNTSAADAATMKQIALDNRTPTAQAVEAIEPA